MSSVPSRSPSVSCFEGKQRSMADEVIVDPPQHALKKTKPEERISLSTVLKPALDGIARCLLLASSQRGGQSDSLGLGSSLANRKRPRGNESDPLNRGLSSSDDAMQNTEQLIEHLVQVTDLMYEYQTGLLPAAGVILSHLTPVILRRSAPVEGWESVSVAATYFGPSAMAGTWKALWQQLSVEKEIHPVFLHPAKLGAFETLIYTSYEAQDGAEANVLLGVTLCRAVHWWQRRLFQLQVASQAAAAAAEAKKPQRGESGGKGAPGPKKGAQEKEHPASGPAAPATDAVGPTEDDYLTYSLLLRVVTAAIVCCHPPLPELLQTAESLIAQPLPLGRAAAGGSGPGAAKASTAVLLSVPPIVAATQAQLRCTMAAVLHPSALPLCLNTCRLSIPSQFVAKGADSTEPSGVTSASAGHVSVGLDPRTSVPAAAPQQSSSASLLHALQHPTLLSQSSLVPEGHHQRSVGPAAPATTSTNSNLHAGHTASSGQGAPTPAPPSTFVANDEVPDIIDSDDE
jgi:hypothetical protein